MNADDLGLHPAVQRAVEHCAQLGTITSASVLANGPFVHQVRSITGVSFGAHLNVLRGSPISPPREVRSLLGSDGRFVGSFTGLWSRLTLQQVALREVELEWSRQVESLLSRGFSLSHLDGEKHTHCLPGLFDIACRVAQKYSIGWVRKSAERVGSAACNLGFVRKHLLGYWCAKCPNPPNGVSSPRSVWGIAHQGAAFSPHRARAALRGIESGSIVEIVCHPGVVAIDDSCIDPSFGRMKVARLWDPEFQSLSASPWLAMAAQERWSLVGFDRLKS